MYQVEKRHIFGYGTMETKWVVYDVTNHKTIKKYYDTKKQAEKALSRKLSSRIKSKHSAP